MATGAISSPGRRASDELRVMTFNIRVRTFLDTIGNSWGSRREMVVSTVREFDPDILGTQEALADQADFLRENLSDYGFVGAGRENGQRGGEMCGIYYRSSRFELIDSGHFWLSDRPEQPGSRSWGSAYPRMVTWAKLRPRVGGEPLCIFNTHFDVYGSRARLESARLLRQRMQTIAPGMACIITGDFNDVPESAPYRLLLADGFIDTYRATHADIRANDDGTRHNYHGGMGGPRIDWIVTTPGLRAVQVEIIRTNRDGKYPSDHYPVAAVLKLPAPLAQVE